MNEQQIAQAALMFLDRVQMSRAEVHAYDTVIKYLSEKARPAVAPEANAKIGA